MTPLTDAIYDASRDPRILAIKKLVKSDGTPDYDARNAAAFTLDANGSGLILDREIDIFGFSPALVMGVRQQYGYAWLPNAFQPNVPLGDLGDLRKMFPRGIRVSTDAADYRPFAPPVPAPPVSSSPVGQRNGDLFEVNLVAAQIHGKWLFDDGEEYPEGGTTYVFHKVPGMFGSSVWWTVKPTPQQAAV